MEKFNMSDDELLDLLFADYKNNPFFGFRIAMTPVLFSVWVLVMTVLLIVDYGKVEKSLPDLTAGEFNRSE